MVTRIDSELGLLLTDALQSPTVHKRNVFNNRVNSFLARRGTIVITWNDTEGRTHGQESNMTRIYRGSNKDTKMLVNEDGSVYLRLRDDTDTCYEEHIVQIGIGQRVTFEESEYRHEAYYARMMARRRGRHL